MRLSCKIYFLCHSIHIEWLLGRDDIVENELVNISSVFAFVLNDIFRDRSFHQKFIFMLILMQVMHVAVIINYHIRHKCTI